MFYNQGYETNYYVYHYLYMAIAIGEIQSLFLILHDLLLKCARTQLKSQNDYTFGRTPRAQNKK